MNIITNRPIINENSSNASGKSKRDIRKEEREQKRGAKKLGKEGFFSDSKKEDRKSKREERKSNRKAKRSARKLKLDRNKDGSITYKGFTFGICTLFEIKTMPMERKNEDS